MDRVGADEIMNGTPLAKPGPAGIVGLELGGVDLWKEGEEVSPEEMQRRVTQGLLNLRQKGSA